MGSRLCHAHLKNHQQPTNAGATHLLVGHTQMRQHAANLKGGQRAHPVLLPFSPPTNGDTTCDNKPTASFCMQTLETCRHHAVAASQSTPTFTVQPTYHNNSLWQWNSFCSRHWQLVGHFQTHYVANTKAKAPQSTPPSLCRQSSEQVCSALSTTAHTRGAPTLT